MSIILEPDGTNYAYTRDAKSFAGFGGGGGNSDDKRGGPGGGCLAALNSGDSTTRVSFIAPDVELIEFNPNSHFETGKVIMKTIS